MTMVRAVLVVLVVVSFVGCAGPPAAPPVPQDFDDLGVHLPGIPAGMLTGFDPFIPDRDIAPGDELLLGVEFNDGDAKKVWSVCVTVVRLDTPAEGSPTPMIERRFRTAQGRDAVFRSRRWILRIRAWDGEGRELGDSEEPFPVDFLRRGFLQACQTAHRLRTPRPGEAAPAQAADAIIGGVVTLFSVIELIRRVPQLDTILWEVVAKPSPLTVLLKGGITVRVTPGFDKAAALTSPPPHLPVAGTAWSFPVDLEVNGTPALRCRLLVTAPYAPLHIAGGVLALVARHPTDETRRLRIQIAAARTASR